MSRSRRGNRSRKGTAKAPLGEAFWGREPDAEPGPIRVSPDPSAMIRSLGPPPLKGHEVAAEYTFRLVYDKAAGLAGTLAAAAELDGDPDDSPTTETADA
ncbi:hypothetical protein [Rhabdothermincola salaria]|uniref:hypothetical protein n=1 Tax=Rhabdothermincola salaria TaxID=2903142 RepID=UPI001E442954|nr:hypothetical protein [Rhabdothermincola salaria]MCD9624154.1 hypothetical protein [Rhabdothermincola salaria]